MYVTYAPLCVRNNNILQRWWSHSLLLLLLLLLLLSFYFSSTTCIVFMKSPFFWGRRVFWWNGQNNIDNIANRSARAMYDEIVWYIYTLQWYIYTHTQNCSEYLLFAAFLTQQVTHLHNLQWIYRDILSRCNTSSKLSVLTSWAKKAKKELLFFGTQVNFCLKYGLERG